MKSYKISQQVYDFIANSKKSVLKVHQVCWMIANNKIIPTDENGNPFVIHHKDGNHYNNSPENLECITGAEHCKITNDEQMKEWKSMKTSKFNQTDAMEMICFAKLGFTLNEVADIFECNPRTAWKYTKKYPIEVVLSSGNLRNNFIKRRC